MGTSRLSSFNPFPGSVDPNTSANAETLKTLLSSSTASNGISPLMSSNSFSERESRTEGLTLAELEESIAIGRKDGDWSHLIGLLSAVFSSYEALSSSFPAHLDSNKTDISSDSLSCPGHCSLVASSQPRGDGSNEIRDVQVNRPEEAPMDEDGEFSLSLACLHICISKKFVRSQQ